MSDSKQTISVVSATWNGEKLLPYCLDAIKDWADEIIIVDGTSSDHTADIARKYTDNVIITDNKPMIHTNKNMAIDAATCDWVLQLDQDEVITPALRDEILKTINSNPEENGFWIPRLNYFSGHFVRKGGLYPDATIRLYRRGTGRLAEKTIHEQATIDGKVGWLSEPMLHFSYPSISLYLTKFNKFSTLIALEMEEGKVSVAKPALLQYFFIKPIVTFCQIYFRHKGFQDGIAGYWWALLSALIHTMAYIKYLERTRKPEHAIAPVDWQ